MEAKMIKKQFDVVRNENGEVTTLTINGGNVELDHIVVKSHNQAGVDNVFQAVYAGLDYLRLGKYDHHLTQEGLHFYTPRGIESSMFNPSMGAVSIHFDNYDDVNIHKVNQKDFPFGWATVGMSNRIYSLNHAKNEEVFARKHNFIDFLVMGYSLEVRVPAFLARPKVTGGEAWIEAMLDVWTTVNDGEALRKSSERINAKIDREFLYEPIRKAKALEGVTARDLVNVNGETVITMLDNTQVELSDLPMRRYNIYNRSRVIDSITWDGGDFAIAKIGQAVKREWKLDPR